MLCFSKCEAVRSGELLTIKVFQAPVDDYRSSILSYINPRMPWKCDTFIRVSGGIAAQCKDMFFVGELNKKIVSLMWYTVCGDVATYGMVSTAEKHRNKGISSCLMKYCIEYLEREPGLMAVYLGVSNPLAQRIYEKNGWLPYFNGTENDTCIMRRLITSNICVTDFDAEYFKTRPVMQIRKVLRGDLPKLEALYNSNGSSCRIKDYNASINKNTAVECQIIDLVNRMEDGEGLFYCIENIKGRIVGAATLYWDIPQQGNTPVLDFFVHDSYIKFANALLNDIVNSKIINNGIMNSDNDDSKSEIVAVISLEDGRKAEILKRLSKNRRINIMTL